MAENTKICKLQFFKHRITFHIYGRLIISDFFILSSYISLIFIFVLDKNQDQLATIIHRGRDHGLPTYTQVRESCGLQPVTAFQELNNTVDTKTIEALQETYKVF